MRYVRLGLLILGGWMLLSLPVSAQSATFYANRFVGRKMANGQVYNHSKFVAAHPSLPFGTRVKVTNRKNRKSVVVVVTDRCHCSIDLSKSAFQAIANLKQGRVPVSINRL